MAKVLRKSKAEPKKEVNIFEVQSVSAQVEDELSGEGIVLFNNDNVVEDYLQLPADLTEVTSQELGRYFNAFTQQKMYVRTVIGRLSAVVREKNNAMNVLRAEVYSSLNAKVSQREKELQFQSDPRVQGQVEDLFVFDEKLRMASDYLDGLIDGITLISREISRRESDWNDDRRNDNVSNKRR